MKTIITHTKLLSGYCSDKRKAEALKRFGIDPGTMETVSFRKRFYGAGAAYRASFKVKEG